MKQLTSTFPFLSQSTLPLAAISLLGALFLNGCATSEAGRAAQEMTKAEKRAMLAGVWETKLEHPRHFLQFTEDGSFILGREVRDEEGDYELVGSSTIVFDFEQGDLGEFRAQIVELGPDRLLLDVPRLDSGLFGLGPYTSTETSLFRYTRFEEE